MNRVRQLGGTSGTWTGKWRKFERVDIEGRAWLPESRWPIAWSDIQTAYSEVARDYGISLPAEGALDDDLAHQRDAFEKAGFGVTPF